MEQISERQCRGGEVSGHTRGEKQRVSFLLSLFFTSVTSSVSIGMTSRCSVYSSSIEQDAAAEARPLALIQKIDPHPMCRSAGLSLTSGPFPFFRSRGKKRPTFPPELKADGAGRGAPTQHRNTPYCRRTGRPSTELDGGEPACEKLTSARSREQSLGETDLLFE